MPSEQAGRLAMVPGTVHNTRSCHAVKRDLRCHMPAETQFVAFAREKNKKSLEKAICNGRDLPCNWNCTKPRNCRGHFQLCDNENISTTKVGTRGDWDNGRYFFSGPSGSDGEKQIYCPLIILAAP